MRGKDINKLWIAFVILLAAIGTANAAPTVVINQSGRLFVGTLTSANLSVEMGISQCRKTFIV